MRIVMVGTGYVGLTTGACLAEFGHTVVCIDCDRDKIALINGGGLPIFEPGLGEIVASNVEAGRLSFSTDLASSLPNAQAIFIAVGTPSRHRDGQADLSHVYTVVKDMAPALPSGALVIVKSTVPVGTGDEVERLISECRPALVFDVVSNPEFLRAGAAIYDFKHPDRIVVGTDNNASRDKVAEIYQPLFLNAAPILYTSRRSAELIKYAANAFLAAKIAFINEVADLCEQVGAEVQDVARGVGLDKRIGPKFLNAGPGFGGSCFPKDALALTKLGEDHGAPMRIIESVLAANDARKRSMARKVAAVLGGSLRGKTVALLGLTFKPNTDDLREAPSIALITGLLDMGASIRAYDPVGVEQAKRVLPGEVNYCTSAYTAAAGADALVIVTEWEQFRALDFCRLKQVMRSPVVADLRNIYRAEDVVSRGFRYFRIGSRAVPEVQHVVAALPPIVPARRRKRTKQLQKNGASPGSNIIGIVGGHTP